MEPQAPLYDQVREPSRNDRGFKILYWIWVLMLFLPERLISFYIPSLQFLRSLPTALLALALIVWFASNKEKHNYKWFTVFLVSLLISSLFAENTGRARVVLRLVLEYYILALITFSFVNNKYRTEKLMFLFMLQFLYLGVWGIIGGGLIKWDYILNEEDAYGPLMGIGVAYCYYYFSVQKRSMTRTLSMIALCVCITGVVISFARGAFLVLAATLIYLLVKSGNFIKGLFLIGIACIVIVVATSIIFPDNAFWKEMQTSTEGTSAGTGRDRKVLWSIAWEEYKDNLIIGVGPLNFGVAAAHYLDKVKDTGNYRPDTIWGRALHNAYFQILCELGTLGIIIFIMILYDFFKTNRATMRYNLTGNAGELDNQTLKQTKQLVSGIKVAMIAFLLNAFFYDIIYYSWFWILLIFNRMLNINICSERIFDKKSPSKTDMAN
jgi:O-antigen ligase